MNKAFKLFSILLIGFGLSICRESTFNNEYKYNETHLLVLRDDGDPTLDDFIDTFMHMDETDNNGYCADEEHAYYDKAKEAFNNLTNEQRKTFATDPKYSDAYTRFTSWANSNGESVYIDEKGNVYYNKDKSIIDKEKNKMFYIIAASATTLLIASGAVIIVVLRKKPQ